LKRKKKMLAVFGAGKHILSGNDQSKTCVFCCVAISKRGGEEWIWLDTHKSTFISLQTVCSLVQTAHLRWIFFWTQYTRWKHPKKDPILHLCVYSDTLANVVFSLLATVQLYFSCFSIGLFLYRSPLFLECLSHVLSSLSFSPPLPPFRSLALCLSLSLSFSLSLSHSFSLLRAHAVSVVNSRSRTFWSTY